MGVKLGFWHAVFAINNRHATNFSSFYSFNSQKAHYTSLFFFPRLRYWCWTTTCSADLTCSTINTRLVCKGTMSMCFPESPPDIHTVSTFQCYQLGRHERYVWWPFSFDCPSYMEKILPQHHFVHHRSRVGCPRCEPTLVVLMHILTLEFSCILLQLSAFLLGISAWGFGGVSSQHTVLRFWSIVKFLLNKRSIYLCTASCK
jgi:hypothetical protein